MPESPRLIAPKPIDRVIQRSNGLAQMTGARYSSTTIEDILHPNAGKIPEHELILRKVINFNDKLQDLMLEYEEILRLEERVSSMRHKKENPFSYKWVNHELVNKACNKLFGAMAILRPLSKGAARRLSVWKAKRATYRGSTDHMEGEGFRTEKAAPLLKRARKDTGLEGSALLAFLDNCSKL